MCEETRRSSTLTVAVVAIIGVLLCCGEFVRIEIRLNRLDSEQGRLMMERRTVLADNWNQGSVFADDCSEVYKSGVRRNDIYNINPDGRGPFQVYCDMTTDGGGWTVFQRRRDGSVNFYRDWNQYKTGFGNLNGEFWLGNDYLRRLTTRASTLRVELEDWGGVRKYAKYGSFSVGDEVAKYRLNVGSYSGTAGDSLGVHNNMAFSTKDRDNDYSGVNCAVHFTGAWWYNDCGGSNLNGQYLGNKVSIKGIEWWHFRSDLSLKSSEMKLRPQSHS